MAIRKLLLPLTGTAAGEAALSTALIAARIWNAHVTALHVRVDSRDVAPLAGEGLSGAMIEEMMTATERESTDRSHAVRALFERFVASQGVQVTDASRSMSIPTASFASIIGREEDLVAQQARLADLTVVPHPEAGEDVSSSDALHAVLFDSGCPVLVAPHIPPTSLGTRICVAWNGSPQSAAAVRAALPWLQRAAAVRVLTSDEYVRRGPLAADMITYLHLHGISPDLATFRSVDRLVGVGLLAAAKDFDADLLAMGAYSQSRLRQMILGGVTRTVLEKSKLPLLMCR